MMPRELSTERRPELLGKNLPGYPVPALVEVLQIESLSAEK
jgi:hypothetical protein